MQSHIRGASPRVNNPTERFDPVPRPRPVDLEHAYGFARGVVELCPPLTTPGHRFVWLRGASYASTALLASEDGFTVVGRHTNCAISLADDPFVALRHVLARSLVLPNGTLALRLFDLHTGTGFFLADRSRQTSVLAEGPVVFSVGEFAFVAFPQGAANASAEPLPAAAPVVELESSAHLRDQLAALDRAMSPYRVSARPSNRSSRITSLPPALVVGEPLPPSLGRLTGGRYELTLGRADMQASVTLSDEDLARGVVIGRSEKCHAEALRRVTEEGTSRVHVLVLREGAAIHAYDLASTQGTYLGARRVRRARLPEAGSAMLILGNTRNAVRLAWRAG